MSETFRPGRETLRYGDVRVVRWSGTVSTDAAMVARADLVGWLDAGERLFVFNLIGVTRMSSFVIGVLVACLKRTRTRRAALHLVLTPAQIRVFELLGLDVVFPLYLREQDAVGDLQRAAGSPGP